VSNYHANVVVCDDLAPTFPHPLDAVNALRNVALSAVASVLGGMQRRLTEQRFARLSDHMLRDFGYERDWDGTIRSLRDAD